MHKQEMVVPILRFSEFTGKWQEANLGSLSNKKLQNGVFNDPQKVGSGYRLINVKDMYQDTYIDGNSLSRLELSENEFRGNKVIDGDTFFTRSSLVKEGIAYSNMYTGSAEDITFDGHLIRLRPNHNVIEPRFLNALLKTHNVRREIISYGKTGTMTTIGQEDLSKCKVVYPELNEQRKIAAFLNSIDDKIIQLQKKKDLLEDYKKGCMQKLFSQKLRFKDEKGKAFPDWEQKRLAQLGKFVGGGTPDTTNESLWNGNINWFTPTELKQKYVSKSNRKITEAGLKESSAKLLPKGGVLLSTRATVGDVSIAKAYFSTNQGFQSLVVNENNNNEFCYYLLNTQRKQIIRKSSGSTFLEISKKGVENLQVEVPVLGEQKKIANFLSAIDEKIDLVSKELDQAKTFKKGLLQQMFV